MFDLNVDRIERLDMSKKTIQDARNLITGFEPNAFYVAKVVNTEDIYGLGRIQIRIPSIHGMNATQKYYLTDSALPWARPAILAGGGNDMGQFIIPVVGTAVFVTFEYNNPERPIYFGGIPGLRSGNPKDFNDNRKVYYGKQVSSIDNDRIRDLEPYSAQQVIFKSLKGSTIIVNDKDGKESIRIIDAAGQQIIMENNNGETPLPRRGNNIIPKPTASIRVISGGQIKLDCDDFNISANTTNLNDYVTPGGDGDKTYIHNQSVSSDTWVVIHNLHKYPSVSVMDSAGSEVEGEVHYDSLNQVTIIFSVAFSGMATLN